MCKDITRTSKKATTKKNSNLESKIPPGKPVYTANLIIRSSAIEVEIENSSSSDLPRKFDHSDEGLSNLFNFLREWQVKGVRLKGNRKMCCRLVEKLLKRGIKPLLTGNHKAPSAIEGMPVIDHYVAGIDIGKGVIYVAIPPNFDKDHTRAFETYSTDLNAIVEWLKEHKIKTVAMESTSVYWMPLYDLCELNGIKALIVNPKHVKMLPGRKTDALDSQWLMRLLACGMLKGGFIPSIQMRILRDLARHRQDLMDRGGDALNKIHKMLDYMNIKLSSVLSDINGKSGINIIRSILEGERDPLKLATLVDKQVKASKEEIIKSLQGVYDNERIFMMKQEFELYEFIHKKIEETELKVKEQLEKLPDLVDISTLPLRSKKRRNKKEYNKSPYCYDLRPLLYQKFGCDLTIIKGIEESSAAVILFETGGSMNAFDTIKHFSSWAAVSPGTKISGGKKISGKAPKKFSRVGQTLRMAAMSNSRSDNAAGAFYRRLIRKGKTSKAANKAVAHMLATQVYNMLKHGQEYVEISAAAFEKKEEERKVKGMIKAFHAMGYEISVKKPGEEEVA